MPWNKPWDAGAQFSSLSVYSETFNLNLDQTLYSFITNKLDRDTGSYFVGKPQHSRQIINGAMKVISGLDWLNKEIHLPNKLIDFCLDNKPEFEGCDLVDYVYVLFKCSSQSTYRKKEINDVLLEVLDYLKLLYHKEEKDFLISLKDLKTIIMALIFLQEKTLQIFTVQYCLFGLLL